MTAPLRSALLRLRVAVRFSLPFTSPLRNVCFASRNSVAGSAPRALHLQFARQSHATFSGAMLEHVQPFSTNIAATLQTLPHRRKLHNSTPNEDIGQCLHWLKIPRTGRARMPRLSFTRSIQVLPRFPSSYPSSNSQLLLGEFSFCKTTSGQHPAKEICLSKGLSNERTKIIGHERFDSLLNT